MISKVLDLIISIKWNNFYMCVWLWYLCQFSYKTTKICLLPFLCEQMWECVLCYSFHWWCILPDFQLTARFGWKLYTLCFAPYHPISMYIPWLPGNAYAWQSVTFWSGIFVILLSLKKTQWNMPRDRKEYLPLMNMKDKTLYTRAASVITDPQVSWKLIRVVFFSILVKISL